MLKTPLISALSAYISKTAQLNFFLLQNFDKQDNMQAFKKILYMYIFENLTWLWTACTEFF